MFRSDEAIGYPLEMYIPGLSVAVEQEARFSYQQREQKVKRYICNRNGITYYTYRQTATTEEAAQEARLFFRKMDIFITTDLQEDVDQARKMFQKIRLRQH